MMPVDAHDDGQSVAGLRRALAAGDVTPCEVLDLCLDRIRQDDARIGAFTEVLEDSARETAAGIRPDDQRPLAGIPLAVKENRDVAGALVTHGSRALAGRRATEDHPSVARLRAAGAVIVGMTAMSEFGLLPGCEPAGRRPTRNPHDLDRTPGGSSGGSAAAVASGMVPVALGNDAGGSLRIPAAWCRLSTVVLASQPAAAGGPAWTSIAADGLLARHWEDALVGHRILAGLDDLPVTAAAAPRIVLMDEPVRGNGIDAVTRDAFQRFAGELATHVEVVDEVLDWSSPAHDRFFPAWAPGARRTILAALPPASDPDDLDVEPYTRSFLAHAGRVPAASHEAAITALQGWGRTMEERLGPRSVVVSPTTPTGPPPLGVITGDRTIEESIGAVQANLFTWVANALGWWAAAIPVGAPDGLVTSVQVMAPPANFSAFRSACASVAALRSAGR